MAEPAAYTPPPVLDPRSPAAARILRQMNSRLAMRTFFLAKLPLALAAGVRLDVLTPERCTTSVPYGWRSTNPFRSTYFAALSMAAELSTGALGSFATGIAPHPVAMLIVGMTASFEKKATERTVFVCAEGDKILAAVESTLATGEAAKAAVETVGRRADGTVVARFTFDWSFKRRSGR
jgi:hypothetical protein